MTPDTDPEGLPAEPDADLALATHELGEPDALYQVSPARHRTKLYAGVGLVLFGVAANYAWWVHGPGKFGHFEVKLLVLPLVIGIGLLVHMWRNRGLSVLVYPTGVLRLRRGEVESFPWADVTEVRVTGDPDGDPTVTRGPGGEVTGCWLPVTAPTFQVWNAFVQVKRADDAEAKFTPALADFPDLAERVQKGTFAALWTKALADLSAGKPVPFGDVTAEPGGLRAGKVFIPWGEIQEVKVTQKMLTVKRAGGWLGARITKGLAGVPNPHVLFALYSVMTADAAAEPAGPADAEG